MPLHAVIAIAYANTTTVVTSSSVTSTPTDKNLTQLTESNAYNDPDATAGGDDFRAHKAANGHITESDSQPEAMQMQEAEDAARSASGKASLQFLAPTLQ